jgi:hypothetical protein
MHVSRIQVRHVRQNGVLAASDFSKLLADCNDPVKTKQYSCIHGIQTFPSATAIDIANFDSIVDVS